MNDGRPVSEGGPRRSWLLGAIACAWGAQALFGSAHPVWGLVPAAGVVVALRLARVRLPSPRAAAGRPVLAAGAVLVVAALAVRGWRSGSWPPALWDEAIQAYDARCVAAGLPLEPLEGIGYHRGPAWTWTLAIAGRVLGWSYGGLRLVSACGGTLVVALVFALGLRWFGLLPAVIAAGWVAVAPWPVHLSRLLLGNGTVPLAGALIVWVVERPRGTLRFRAAVAGCIAGAAVWGYAAAVVLPVVAALAVLLADREPARLRIQAAGLALAVAALFVLPAALMPGMWAKAAEVSVISRPGQVVRNAVAAVGLFNVGGDPDLRHAYPPGAPVFDGFLGPVFLLGLGLTLAGADRRGRLLLGWFLLALAPGLGSAGGARDLFREAGAIPAVALVAGAGASALPAALGLRTGTVLAACLLAAAGARGIVNAAVLAPADRATGVWYRTWAAEAGRDLAAMATLDPLRFREPLSLARHSVEKLALFDVLHGGGSETGPCGRLVFAREWRDSYGQPQAVLLTGRTGRWRTVSYRTVQDIAEECDALVRAGKPRRAVEDARAGVVLIPKSVILRERLGFALLAAGDLAGAEAAFRRAIRAGARLPSVWDGLAAVLFRRGRRAEAEAAILEGLKLAPDDAELRADLARVRVAGPPGGPASMKRGKNASR